MQSDAQVNRGKEAGAGLLLTGNSLPQLLLRLFMPIFRLTLTPLRFHAPIPPQPEATGSSF